MCLHMLLTSFLWQSNREQMKSVEFAGIAPLCRYALDEIEKTPVTLANATFVTFALFLQNLFLFLLTFSQISFLEIPRLICHSTRQLLKILLSRIHLFNKSANFS